MGGRLLARRPHHGARRRRGGRRLHRFRRERVRYATPSRPIGRLPAAPRRQPRGRARPPPVRGPMRLGSALAGAGRAPGPNGCADPAEHDHRLAAQASTEPTVQTAAAPHGAAGRAQQPATRCPSAAAFARVSPRGLGCSTTRALTFSIDRSTSSAPPRATTTWIDHERPTSSDSSALQLAPTVGRRG